eukprot:gene7344-7925_t
MDRSLLSNATTQDDAPTPGYMLAEISKATLANYQANIQLQDFLVSRLTHKHHNVKHKCLVIVKHVCRTGRPEFKREMAKKVDVIKECLQFRGPPDPLRGDEIYKRVRDAAKEALDSIFDSQMPITTSAVAATNRIQGIGNDYVPTDIGKKESGGILSSFVSSVTNAVMGDGTDPVYAGHPGAEGSFIGGADKQFAAQNPSYTAPGNQTIYRSGSSGMTGLGNPNFKDARDEKSWYQKAGETISSYTSSSNPAPATHNFQSNNPDWNYATNRGSNAININQEGYQPQRTNALGSNVTHFQQWQNQSNSGLVTSQTHAVVPDLPPANGLGTGRVGGAASDGGYERALLEALCEPGGLKAIPPEGKLQDFLVTALNLSPDLVGNVLLDLLNADSWQTRVKALIVIGNLVQTRDCGAHKDWWRANHEDVRALCNDSKAGVRNQASKTYKIITGTVVNVSTSEEAITETPPVSAKINGNATVNVISSPQPPVTANTVSAPPTAGLDLFSGLAVSSSAQPSPTPAAPVSILQTFETSSNPQVPPPAPLSSSSTAISNSFDFLNDDLPPPSQPAPPAPPANDNMFSGMNLGGVTNSPAPVPSTSNKSIIDDFAGLSVGPAPVPSHSPMNNNGGGGGGFSFINNNNNNSSNNSRPTNPINPSYSVISSVFVENNANTARAPQNDSFAQLVNLGGGNSSSAPASSSSGRYVPAPAPANPGYAVNNGVRYAPAPAPGAPAGYYAQPYPGQPGVYPVQPVYPPQQPVYPQQPVGGPLPNAYANNPSNPFIAPGMLNPLAPRKNIPTTDAVGGGSSGFSFLGSSGPAATGGNDSFNFVSDAMKDMNKK